MFDQLNKHLPRCQCDWMVVRYASGEICLYPGTEDSARMFGIPELTRVRHRDAATLCLMSRRHFRRQHRRSSVPTVFRISTRRFDRLFTHPDGKQYTRFGYFVPNDDELHQRIREEEDFDAATRHETAVA